VNHIVIASYLATFVQCPGEIRYSRYVDFPCAPDGMTEAHFPGWVRCLTRAFDLRCAVDPALQLLPDRRWRIYIAAHVGWIETEPIAVSLELERCLRRRFR
jgi:hypothetical protein